MTLSRQRAWQLKQKAARRCHQCAHPAPGGGMCQECREKVRARNRERYRISHNIATQAPLQGRGRPRKDTAS